MIKGNKMRNRTLKEKTVLFSLSFFAAVVLIAAFMTVIGTRRVFDMQTAEKLEQLAGKKTLEFEGGLQSQIALVLQMTKSPAFRRYMEHPSDAAAAEYAQEEVAAYQDSFLAHSSFWVSDADLQFYSNGERVYTLDPNDSAQYWYKMTLNGEDDYNFNINYNPDLQNTNLWINAVVRAENGKAIGVAGTGIPLDGFFDTVYADLDSRITMFMYNDALEITGTTDKSLLEAKVNVAEKLPELSQHAIAGALRESVISTRRGVYVTGEIATVGWHIVLFMPFTFADILSSSLLSSAAILIIVALLIILVFALFVLSILKSMKKVISDTKESATEQAFFMKGVKNTVAENVGSIDRLGELMQRQNATISQSQEHISGLSAMISSVDGIRRDSIQNTHELENSSAEGEKMLAVLEEKIAGFEKCTQHLVQTNNLISGITGKTNLLAINAGIEASHAGENGKSFAVVAKEIRELAERSRSQEQGVADSIDEMLVMMKEMTQSSVAVKQSFAKIVENSKRVMKNFEEMSHAIEEQNVMEQTVDANLRELMEDVRQTGESFSKMRGENETLSENIESASTKAEGLLEAANKVLQSTGI